MARIRTIKPEFFTSEDIVSLTPFARLLYIALWCEADREGRMQWKPRTFKMRYFPADGVDIDSLCQEILDAGLVVCYGDGLAYIPRFGAHQHVNPREAASALPYPAGPSSRVVDASSTREHASCTVSDARVGREGKGKEGKEINTETTSLVLDPSGPSPEPTQSGYAVPICPTAEIVKAYADALPALPQVAVLSDSRRRSISARWREVCASEKFDRERGLEFFGWFFRHVGESEFLTGRSPPGRNRERPFRADLDWLMAPSNFTRIVEGRYHAKAVTA